MNTLRTNSSPDLHSSYQYDDSALEGVAANVKLLLKLIQDHKHACNKGQKDSRRMLRVAGMMTVLDNVRTRIQKCQSFGIKRSTSDVKLNCNVPKDRKTADEMEALSKQLNTSLAAQKNLERMCSSLGKEKEIMVKELARKNSELSDLEEHINDLKTQNNSLLGKVKEFATGQSDKAGEGMYTSQGNVDLQDQNKVLSQQLLRSLDGYRYLKRKLRDSQVETLQLRETMREILEKARTGLQRVRELKMQNDKESNTVVEIKECTTELENVLQSLQVMVSKHV
ncbi:myosin heavy chain, striated muscle [Heracleum sosnowskyi]|uniref:Myosin heavy chain, striated muscle n=1 Tax=Heracleum sosnowskyi TaxID=360622 RepID=A0AAD8MJI8_9APIA|nr:myosin heavy chain, striated muscle [Heracleum sosnowskyi]